MTFDDFWKNETGQDHFAAALAPDGWQLVPKVPTEEMLLAGMGDDWPEDLYLRDVYELMLEAAPNTPNVEVTGSPALSASPSGLPGSASADHEAP